jgi:hypothetical protein
MTRNGQTDDAGRHDPVRWLETALDFLILILFACATGFLIYMAI